MDGKPFITRKSVHQLSDPAYKPTDAYDNNEIVHVPTRCEKCCFNICTCCGCKCMVRFRHNQPNCSKFICYTLALYGLILIGGIIFHYCEFDNEKKLIEEKSELISQITAQLNSSIYTTKLDRLIALSNVPDNDSKNRYKFCWFPRLPTKQNYCFRTFEICFLLLFFKYIDRWSIARAQFFAFTTASTIGYGFQAPSTGLGRLFTFLYGLPAIAFFGLAMVNIGSIMWQKIDANLRHREAKLASEFYSSSSDNLSNVTKCRLYLSNLIGYERKRVFVVLILLIILILVGGGILHRSEDFSFADGCYFMWVCAYVCYICERIYMFCFFSGLLSIDFDQYDWIWRH